MSVQSKEVTNNRLNQNPYSFIRLFLSGIDNIDSLQTNSFTLRWSDDSLFLYLDNRL